MINAILRSGIELSVGETGKLAFKGRAETVKQWKPALRQWKLELLKVAVGETITNVGHCDHCGANLIGLPVSFDGYVNRVCGDCGRWAVCLPPEWTPDDLAEHIAERSAIMEHEGQLSREEADSEAVKAVRAQLDEQKALFESMEGIL